MNNATEIESLKTMLRAAQAVIDNLRAKLRGPFTNGECSFTLAKVAGWLDPQLESSSLPSPGSASDTP